MSDDSGAPQNLQWTLNGSPVSQADVNAAVQISAEYPEQSDPGISVRVYVFKAEDVDESAGAPTDMSRSLGSAAASYGSTSLSGTWSTEQEQAGKAFYFYVTIGDPSNGGQGALSPRLVVAMAVSIDPAAGDAAGGTPVTIKVAEGYRVASAEIGGVPITEFSASGPLNGIITGKTGAHDAGAADVVLKDSDGNVVGQLAGGFTYNPSEQPAGGDDQNSEGEAGSNDSNTSSNDSNSSDPPAGGGGGDTGTSDSNDTNTSTDTAAPTPSNLQWLKDGSAVTSGAASDALTLSFDLTHGDGNQVSIAVYAADQVDGSGNLVDGATALDPAPTATEKDDQSGFTADWTVPGSGDGFYFQVSVTGASGGDPVTALSGKLEVSSSSGGATPSNLQWQKDGSAVTNAAASDALTLSFDLAHGDDNQVSVAVYGADQVDGSGNLVDGATALDPAPSATEKDDQSGFTADWTVPDSGDGFYFQVSVTGASGGDPQTALSGKLEVSAGAAPGKPAFYKEDAQDGDDPITQAAAGDKVQVKATYPAHGDDVTPTLKIYNAADVSDTSQAPDDSVQPLATIDDASEADDKKSISGTWQVTAPPAGSDGSDSQGVYALVTVGSQSTFSELLTLGPPAGPSNLRWDTPGADTSSADPLTEAAVGDSVQLSCQYGPRPDGSSAPTVAIYKAQDASALASAQPLATVSITENDDKTGFTATWTVAPPWRSQSSDGSSSQSDGGDGSDTSTSQGTGSDNQVTASSESVTALFARKPDDAGSDGGSSGDGTPSTGGGSSGDGSSGGDGGDGGDQILFSVQPDVAFELVAKLDGFSAAPTTKQFEFYTQPPGTGDPDEPPGVIFVVTMDNQPQSVSPSLAITGAGAPPLFSLPAEATTEQETASWTYSPEDPAQATLQLAVWIVAVANSATHTAVLSLAHASMTDLRWVAADAGPDDGALKAVTVGQSVALVCEVSGYNAKLKASVEVYSVDDVSLQDGQPKDGATPLATLDAIVDQGGQLSAPWTVASPPITPPQGDSPAEIPQLVFLVKVGGDHALSAAVSVTPKVRIKLAPGDPNWFMEPIVAHPAPKGAAPAKGDEQDPNRNPDAKTPAADFPNRVLGIKQRLQAIGYYYEPVPDPDSDADHQNVQTRVFKRCLGWYWKNVFPADGSDAPRASDHGEDDGIGVPGAKAIDVAKLKDSWLLDLEDRVRKLVLVQEDGSASGPDVDLTKDARLVLPGDFTFTNQEANLGDKTYHIDYTQLKSDGVYAAPESPLTNRPENAQGADVRGVFEGAVFGRNFGLQSFPVVARLEMLSSDGSWIPGPAEGMNVTFQLQAVGDPSSDPPYLDALGLRSISRVSDRDGGGAFGGRGKGAPVKGPRGYLSEVHDHFRDAATDPNADPTWWNAPSTQGGKRGDGAIGPPTDATAILCTGAPSVLQAKDPAFVWTAVDGTCATDSRPAVPASVSVAVQQGQAGVLFRPSRCGGDAYKLRVYVEGVVDAPASSDGGSSDDAGNSSDAAPHDVSTGVLMVWRRVRVTRWYQFPVPDSWKKKPGSSNDPDFTPKDAIADPTGSPVMAIDELGGDLVDPDWTKVAAIYKKAFMLLEPPAAKKTIDRAFVDAATKGMIGHLKKLLTKCGSLDKPNWGILLKRAINMDVNVNVVPDAVFQLGADTPFLINFRSGEAYGHATNDHTFDRWPYGPDYWRVLASLFAGDIFAFLGLYMDDDWVKSPKTFDPVPVPGITVVQSLYGDNLAATGERFELFAGIDPVLLAPQAGGDAHFNDDLSKINISQAPWDALGPGDRITLVRYRAQEVGTQRAKGVAPTGDDTVFSHQIWRKIDFTYGPKAKGHDGTTITDLALKIMTDVKHLCRDPAHPDVTFATPLAQSITTFDANNNANPNPDVRVFVLRWAALESRWKNDGLELAFLFQQRQTDGSFQLMQVWQPFQQYGSFDDQHWSGLVFPRFSTSGLAECGRTCFIHYGADDYGNANFRGPDPANGSGPGYLSPSMLFCYDLATNVAHELGHMLYLRHQFTRVDYPRRGLLDHDFDDFCHMSYFTGFVESAPGTYDLAIEKMNVASGVDRDKGRAEPCGRCLLKLRGWDVDMKTFPGNVPSDAVEAPQEPATPPATGGGDS